MDGIGESVIPVAALNSVDRLSHLFLLGVDFLSEEDEGVANNRVDAVAVLTMSSHPPKPRLTLCVLEWERVCRFASGIKAFVMSTRTKRDINTASMLSSYSILIALDVMMASDGFGTESNFHS